MSMKQAKWLVATLLILGVLTYLWGRAPDKLVIDTPGGGDLTEVSPPADCSIKGEGCRLEIEGVGRFHVRIPEVIVPLEKFTFEVRPEGDVAGDVGEVRVDFDMREMDMGENAYRLERFADDSYREDIILPVCTSDVTEWIARLSIRTTEGGYLVELPFNVDRSRPAEKD